MSARVEELLRAYAEEHRRTGDADPMPYLRELRGTDRAELTLLIDAFLAAAPPPAHDAGRFAALQSDPVAARAVERLATEPLSLLEARQQAELGQEALAARLAAELGLGGREAAVKAAYHEIETGRIDPGRVRAPVWQALAGALGVAVDRLREAAARPFVPLERGPVFARAARPAAAPQAEAFAAAAEPPDGPRADERVVRAVFFD